MQKSFKPDSKILENPQVLKTPVVRNGKLSTLGYQPEVWKKWEYCDTTTC
ncbi:MAG: hypothetical protein J6Y89_08920 [Lachnospiraceae bacterium]|nr:hypothetical protein [Lachnospiraceae bacterium]